MSFDIQYLQFLGTVALGGSVILYVGALFFHKKAPIKKEGSFRHISTIELPASVSNINLDENIDPHYRQTISQDL